LTRTTLLMIDKHFICLGEDGTLRLLKVNPQKYEEVASVELRSQGTDGNADGKGEPLLALRRAGQPPLVSHGLLYVRGKDRLVCMELIPRKK